MKTSEPENIIYICMGSKCEKNGSKDCYKKIKKLIKNSGFKNVEVIKTACTDRCDFAPVACFQPENKWLLKYKQDDVLRRITELIK